ncbi:NAD-dependent protein deacetylase (plasmid) [Caballeronia sp. SBC2]|nr:NAD-dependent protein deacetylase [Caballeronia sp. SBC2]
MDSGAHIPRLDTMGSPSRTWQTQRASQILRLYMGFYGHRLALYRETQPHAGFDILRKWSARMVHSAFVFTSNVDGQFQKAGFPPERVVECHGTIHNLQCIQPCTNESWSADDFNPVVNNTTCELESEIPRCQMCDRIARPNILMFGDWGWVEKYAERQRRALDAWLGEVERMVVVELGAGRALPTVRRFSERHGPRVIRINPREHSISPKVGVGFAGGAHESLRLLDTCLNAGEHHRRRTTAAISGQVAAIGPKGHLPDETSAAEN